jgi:hypothetical protein
MADKPPVDGSDRAVLEDDPFAELTRIMGFDPRQPVRSERPVSAAAHQEPDVAITAVEPAPAHHEFDLEMELEQELLGEFADIQPEPLLQASAPALDDDFDFDESLFADVRATEADGRSEPTFVSEPHFAADDHAMQPVAPVVPEIESAPLAVAPAPSVDATEPDMREPAFEPDAIVPDAFSVAPPIEAAAPAPFAAPEPAFEDDVFDFDAEAFRIDEEVPSAETAADHDQVFAHVEEPAMEIGGFPMDEDFDDVLHTAGRDLPPEQAHLVTPEDAAHELVHAPHEVAIDHDFAAGAAPASEPVETYEVDVPHIPLIASAEPVAQPRMRPEEALEMSLEQELNALLGNAGIGRVDERAGVIPQPAHVEPQGHQAEPEFDDVDFDAAFDAVSVAPSDDGAVDPVEPSDEYGAEQPMARDGYDPYAALAALSVNLRPMREAQTEPEPVDEPQSVAAAAPAWTDAPDIDTVDVPEQAVALADDLDLPAMEYEVERARSSSFDDIDAEFSHLLSDMSAAEAEPTIPQQRVAPPASDPFADFVLPSAAVAAGAALSGAAAGGQRAAASDRYDDLDGGRLPDAVEQELADMEFAYDPAFDEDLGAPAYQPAQKAPSRRGYVVAGGVLAVALLGGVAAFALSFGSGGSGQPVLVRADPDPVKVRPENPGGTAVPNQENKVYDSVAAARAGATTAPAQEKLVTTAEEPVELPMTGDDEPVDSAEAGEDGDAVAGAIDQAPAASAAEQGAEPDTATAAASPAAASVPKAEDRVEQAAEPGVDSSVEVAAVAPRKVRTMVVKADGTIVAREETAPASAAAATPDTASESIVEPSVTSSSATTEAPAEANVAVPETAPAAAAPEKAAATAEKPAARASSTTPRTVPIAPTRPSDQPVDIVGEVKAERVAALSPAEAAPAAAGSWAMQIASQPSEAAAQSSYQDLARRYGAVLNGRQASIVKAEIAGKGTFWRVRVPAGSRNDAIKLCESYKAAGGNCFVSK